MQNDYIVEIHKELLRKRGLLGKNVEGYVISVYVPNPDVFCLNQLEKRGEGVTIWYIKDNGKATEDIYLARFHETKAEARKWAGVVAKTYEGSDTNIYLLSHPNSVWAESRQASNVKSSGYGKQAPTLDERVAALEKRVAKLEKARANSP